MKKSILNKKNKSNKKLPNILLFLLVVVVSHLLISFVRYVDYEYKAFSQGKSDVQQYTSVHKKELKNDVFSKLFKESENCILFDNLDLRKKCFQEISYTLALTIKEEEFSYWPNDLFFVKQVDNKFFKIGWDGELQNISNISNIKSLKNNQSSFIDFLSRKCNYFGTANYPADSCEVFGSIKLNNNEAGYLLRKIPLQEEDNFLFYLIIPYMIIVGFITSFTLPSVSDMGFFYTDVLFGLIPFIIGFIAVKLFNKKNGKK